jgi:hypothetical protein
MIDHLDIVAWELKFAEAGNLDDRRVKYLMETLQKGKTVIGRLEKLISQVTKHKVDTGEWAAQRSRRHDDAR